MKIDKNILRIEEMGLNGWPSVSTDLFKGAVLRLAGGYTKRANSCNPLYVRKNEIDSVIKYSEDFYRKKNLPVVFKIVGDMSYSFLESKLQNRSYSKIDLTNVMTMELKTGLYNASSEIDFETEITDKWIENFLTIYKRTQNRELVNTMLKSINQKVITAEIIKDGGAVACGYSVIEDNWVGFFDIYVDEKFRGQGLGRSIMSGLIAKSIENGAKKSYIQVVADNVPAVTLYKSLGYKECYNYWYRVKE